MRILLLIPVLAACSGSKAAIRDLPCGSLDDMCQVEGGEYLAIPPPDWDGESLLPTFWHYHAYNRSPLGMWEDDITQQAAELGAFVVYPIGLDKTWSNVGSPSSGARDEIAFSRRVHADALDKFPIDPDRILVTGFSQGGSMAWDVSCYAPELGTAYAPVSGGFWEPLPAECTDTGRRLRHEHGTRDGTFPLDGRNIGSFRQGDVRAGLEVLREASGCATEPREVQEDGRTCQVWEACGEQGEVQLCLHDGGHRITSGWHGRALEWAFGAE